MIYFIIPLRSRAASKNWEAVSQTFKQTLDSCYNQTSSEFSIKVICHDIPSLDRVYDDRVEFIQVDTIPPNVSDIQGMMRDKEYKMYIGLQEAGREMLIKYNGVCHACRC